MKLVIQRVNHGRVFLADKKKKVGEINTGLFVLLGIGKGDDKKEAKNFAQKLSKLRIMPDEKGKMNLSIMDTNSEILVVSQFTLYADTSDGNRPSFINAAEASQAKEIYQYFIESLKALGIKVKTGSFGDYMKIDLELDGPVTINL